MREFQLGMYGSDVMELQATLNKLGYRIPVDGLFQQQTKEAIAKLQLLFGLQPDGIVGEKTSRILQRYILGYDDYLVHDRDSVESIAKNYKTTVRQILVANPQLKLRPGQHIVVPYDIPVVDTNINYDYTVLEHDIHGLQARYPFLEVGIIGKSVLGRNLYFLKLGKGPHEVMFNAAHHALEWITSVVLMKFVEDFLETYAFHRTIHGYNIQEIWNHSSIYIVPMVNPDGIDLVLNGLKKTNPYYNDLLEWNKGSDDFSLTWQANVRGVDLNHNYNAAWAESKAFEESYGVDGPGPTRFGGYAPESEPEVRAMVIFTKLHHFYLVLAYHSQGEVIYWDFQNLASENAKNIGLVFSELSGYRLDHTEGIASFSGYKDWFIQEYRRPGYTIEVGRGTNPLPISQFDKIYHDNIALLLEATRIRYGHKALVNK